METEEVTECKNLFYILGRNEKINLLNESNLDDREKEILVMKHISGMTAKEMSEKLSVSVDAYNKMQQKVYKKLYAWLKH